jgi:hypothetical protein
MVLESPAGELLASLVQVLRIGGNRLVPLFDRSEGPLLNLDPLPQNGGAECPRSAADPDPSLDADPAGRGREILRDPSRLQQLRNEIQLLG